MLKFTSMKKKVIVTPDPRLRKKSTKANAGDPEVTKIIKEMIQSCIDWENEHEFELSAAMAAPQLGYNKRIIVVREDMSNKDNATFVPLLNPEVIKTEGKTLYDYEGCLSVPAIYGKVSRPAKARVKAQLEDGTEVRLKATDFLARTLMHEIDHLNGILFIDHIKGQKDAFYKLNDKGDLEPLDYDTYIKDNKELYPDDQD
ncbi:MAG: peptide deformylase [Candidatus Saccharibacteria bacterium]|nr:peptide deformylase [Candidatus Saccharibacteria bacterium]